MSRTAPLVLGGLGILAVGFALGRGTAPPRAPSASPSASASAGSAALQAMDGGEGAAELLPGAAPPQATGAAAAASALEAPLPLPASAPKQVRFGVILIQFRGAQGAPPGARSREEAAAIAKRLAASAHEDFKGTLAQGDQGSAEDLGRMPRGVLEAPTEAAIFSLSVGAISDPIDTPRGFWIVRRTE